MSTASEILGRIEDDAVFRGFLDAGFDPAAFASKIVKADVSRAAAAGPSANGSLQVDGAMLPGVGGSTGEQRSLAASAESVSSQAEITLDSMSSHISRIETAIRAHILENEEDFLGSVGGVSELSRRTEEFRNGVRELRRSFVRLRREVSEPHEVIRTRTQQLKNLHLATRLLKRALRFVAAARRLRAQEDALGLAESAANGGGGTGGKGGADLRELAKAAQCLQELESTLRDPDVAELDVVSRERPYVEACGSAVRRMSADYLARGLKGLNQTDVGGALQVFFNLGCLSARVKACVAHLADEADAAASLAFQPAALAEAYSAAGSSSSGGSTEPTSPPPAAGGSGRATSAREAEAAALRRRAARMRAHTGKLAASLYGTSMEAWGLERVLLKKRDPSTRALLDTTVRGDRAAGLAAGAYRAFWDGLCRAVRGAVERALAAEGIDAVVEKTASGGPGWSGGRGHASAGAAMVAMYPFLRKAFLHLMTRLERGTRGAHGAKRAEEGGSAGAGSEPSAVISSASVIGAGIPFPWSAGSSGGGVLGGSRWLSLALLSEGDSEGDDDDDDRREILVSSGQLSSSSSSNRSRSRRNDRSIGDYGGGSGTAGFGAGGAEAGGGPTRSGEGMGVSVLRRRGLLGTAAEGENLAGTTREEGGDGARLLEALGPLRDLFLARSLERLTLPVEQMFPQFDGYTAAVPSKHDLASFVRSIQAEIALAVPTGSTTAAGATRAPASGVVSEAEAGGGGNSSSGAGGEADPSLAPLLLKGVVQAVKLLCTKVEAMHSVEEGAYTFGGGSRHTGADDMGNGVVSGSDTSAAAAAAVGAASGEAWAPTTEQEHNLQLLELMSKLREALLGLPSLATPPDGEEGGGELESRCREHIGEAVGALDDTASSVILEPYLSGVACALEAIIAKMHRENFGPSDGDGHGEGDECSLFLVELRGALAALHADHFSRISALRTPCALELLRSLAARVLRAYVTHCALLRPLSRLGKARVSQDMATLEIALSPLARIPDLGAVYEEGRGLLKLLCVYDEDEGCNARTLAEACKPHLRPSTVCHHLFSSAPDELSSPHLSRGMSEQAYVTWLLGGGAAAEAKAREDAGGDDKTEKGGAGGAGAADTGSDALDQRSTLSPDTSFEAEAAAWAVVQECLDAYHQRRSATAGSHEGDASAKGLPRAVALLPDVGPALLYAYEARDRDVKSGSGSGSGSRKR